MDTADTRYIPYMWEALREGRKALPDCRSNPPVGCVLVRHDRIIARGYTQPLGAPHAEAMALSQVSGGLVDVTAVVTLEPYLIRSGSDPLSQGDRYGIRTRNG